MVASVICQNLFWQIGANCVNIMRGEGLIPHLKQLEQDVN
jgi:hypothetical protein